MSPNGDTCLGCNLGDEVPGSYSFRVGLHIVSQDASSHNGQPWDYEAHEDQLGGCDQQNSVHATVTRSSHVTEVIASGVEVEVDNDASHPLLDVEQAYLVLVSSNLELDAEDMGASGRCCWAEP